MRLLLSSRRDGARVFVHRMNGAIDRNLLFEVCVNSLVMHLGSYGMRDYGCPGRVKPGSGVEGLLAGASRVPILVGPPAEAGRAKPSPRPPGATKTSST